MTKIGTFVYRLLISTPLSVESGSFEGSPGLISQRTYSDSNLLKSTGVQHPHKRSQQRRVVPQTLFSCKKPCPVGVTVVTSTLLLQKLVIKPSCRKGLRFEKIRKDRMLFCQKSKLSYQSRRKCIVARRECSTKDQPSHRYLLCGTENIREYNAKS